MARRSARRKGGATTGDGEPSKKSKMAPAEAVWEWEGDGGKWSSFSDDHCQLLSEGLRNGEKSVALQVSDAVKMNVRFGAMTQTNTRTGWQRNVRCVPLTTTSSSSSSGDTSGGQRVWEWENGDREWTPFSPVSQQLLHACKLCGVESISVEVTPRKRSKVDLKGMKHEMAGRKGLGVRCNPLAVWEWQNEHGQWIPYDTSTSKDLEDAHTTEMDNKTASSDQAPGTQVSITAVGRSYTVDIVKMEQRNDSTSVTRKIRRRSPTSEGDNDATSSLNAASSSDEATPNSAGKATPTSTTETTPTTMAASTSKATPTSVPCTSDSSDPGPCNSTDGSGHVTRELHGSGIPVDYVCSQKVGKAQVYSEDGVHWDAMLNQTNLKNNNNKFYLLQLLKDNAGTRYSTWFRWGRVGKTGSSQLTGFGPDLERAKDTFRKKFHDKTLNKWEERDSFVKHAGKYDLLTMDYRATTEEEEEEEADGDNEEVEENVDDGERDEEAEKKTAPESQLDARLQALIRLICDVKVMEDAVVEMKYDPRKAPLGKLTKDQIKLGYAALKKIDECISQGRLGDQLVQACDQFYTRIPHDFGMGRPPIIRTKEDVKEKIALLETLGDIEIALRVMKEGDKKEHPLDRHYHGLHCKLEPLEQDNQTFQLVEQYVRQTHAATHNSYTLTVQEVFEMDKERQEENFKDVGNKQLLWHGSRLTNWVGILSQGLRVAPPEAPVTGYMFGKGVYFADMCSKSANYCFASRARQEGLLILCEVALGQTNDLLEADYDADKLLRGKHSTRGLGSVAPDPNQANKLPDGCVVPLGTSIDTGVHNPKGYTLNYNEYVIYDTDQIKMRYLVRVRFNFK